MRANGLPVRCPPKGGIRMEPRSTASGLVDHLIVIPIFAELKKTTAQTVNSIDVWSVIAQRRDYLLVSAGFGFPCVIFLRLQSHGHAPFRVSRQAIALIGTYFPDVPLFLRQPLTKSLRVFPTHTSNRIAGTLRPAGVLPGISETFVMGGDVGSQKSRSLVAVYTRTHISCGVIMSIVNECLKILHSGVPNRKHYFRTRHARKLHTQAVGQTLGSILLCFLHSFAI